MATTLKSAFALSAVISAFTALASCGDSDGGDNTGASDTGATQANQLFPDDFKGVCSGASVSTATAYDPNAASHKALYFASYEDDFTDRSSSLPADWTVQFSPDSDALQAIDLVVCARRTAARQVKVCDGYQNEGATTQNRVNWHTATYELSVREAKTGTQLADTTLEATDTGCPMFMNFDGDSDTVDAYASLSDSAVNDFLREHITQ